MGGRTDKDSTAIPLAVVDPDDLRREGLTALAARSDRVRIRASARTVDALPKRMAANTIAAIAMPRHGVPRRDCLPSMPTILFAESFTDAELFDALGVGANGVLVTPCSTLDLEYAATSVSDAGRFIDPSIADRVVTVTLRGQPGEGPHGLTTQERRVLEKLPDGLTNREIGAELGISHETVKTHMRNAFTKIGARNRRQAAAIVEREGIDRL